MNIAGLILAKSASGRLPNKNILPLNGEPMFLTNVKKCLEIFDKVYVSSDDDDILDWADSRGAIAIKRPIELCGGTPNIPVYQHAIQFMGDVDAIVAVQANSPTVSSMIIEAVKYKMEIYNEVMTCHKKRTIYGSVWGITRKRLAEYKEISDYYNPQPDIMIYDPSIDVHDKEDYSLVLKQL